jgi:hypothetical protein
MASTINPARQEFSEDHLGPTQPSVVPADDLSPSSAYEFGGMGRTDERLPEIKLLAELEKYSGGRPAKASAPRPVSATKVANSKDRQPSLRKRAARGLVRVLIIFTMGVAATLAWQSYGDATRKMIASSYPQLGWLAPEMVVAEITPEITSSIAPATSSSSEEKTVGAEATPETPSPIAPATTFDSQEKTVAAETTPQITSPTAPATTSDSQEIKAILINLAAVQQSVDQLAARQQQMANDIATLKAAEQNILRKISSAPSARPAAAPARKPVPVAPRLPQEPPLR